MTINKESEKIIQLIIAANTDESIQPIIAEVDDVRLVIEEYWQINVSR